MFTTGWKSILAQHCITGFVFIGIKVEVSKRPSSGDHVVSGGFPALSGFVPFNLVLSTCWQVDSVDLFRDAGTKLFVDN